VVRQLGDGTSFFNSRYCLFSSKVQCYSIDMEINCLENKIQSSRYVQSMFLEVLA
jgi:hypothetical protein